MKNKLTLGYSTCPNDTLIFHALVHGLVPLGEFDFEVALKDMEALNQDARVGRRDITKLSFAALGHLRESYGLLHAGAALGRGCGPLIVGPPGADLCRLQEQPVAVPGPWTTACLLLGLYHGGQPCLAPMAFDRIMPAVAAGQFDFGVIIHEGRFTYREYGLEQYVDLGQWWERETGLPIPLGGIAAKRCLPSHILKRFDDGLRRSVEHGLLHPNDSRSYVKQHAQELEDAVITQHIDLYVNKFSVDLGREGAEAVAEFFTRAQQAGLLPASRTGLWAY